MLGKGGSSSLNPNALGGFIHSPSNVHPMPSRYPPPHPAARPSSTYSTWNPTPNFAQPPPPFPQAMNVPVGVSTYIPQPSGVNMSVPPPNMTSIFPPPSNTHSNPILQRPMPPMSSTLMIDGPQGGFLGDDSERDFQKELSQTLAKSSRYVREQDDTIDSIWRSIGMKSKEVYPNAGLEGMKPNQADGRASFHSKLDAVMHRKSDERSAAMNSMGSSYVPMSRNAKEEMGFHGVSASENKFRRSRSRSPFGNIFLDKLANRSADRRLDTSTRRMPGSRSPPARRSSPGPIRRFRSPSPLGGLGTKLIQLSDREKDRDRGNLGEIGEIDELRRTKQQLIDDEKILKEQLRLRPNDALMKNYLRDNTTMQGRLSRQISRMEQTLADRNCQSSSRREEKSNSRRRDDGDRHRDQWDERDRDRREGRDRRERDRDRDAPPAKKPSTEPHAASPLPLVKTNVIYRDKGDHWCQECDVTLATVRDLLQHLKTEEHIKKISRKVPPWASDKPIVQRGAKEDCLKGTEFLLPSDGFYCELCKLFCGDKMEAELHLKSPRHNAIYEEHISQYPSYERKLQQRKQDAARLREEEERRKANKERRQAEAEKQKKEEVESMRQVRRSMSIGVEESKTVITIDSSSSPSTNGDFKVEEENNSRKSSDGNLNTSCKVSNDKETKKTENGSKDASPGRTASSQVPQSLNQKISVKASPAARSILPRKILTRRSQPTSGQPNSSITDSTKEEVSQSPAADEPEVSTDVETMDGNVVNVNRPDLQGAIVVDEVQSPESLEDSLTVTSLGATNAVSFEEVEAIASVTNLAE